MKTYDSTAKFEKILILSERLASSLMRDQQPVDLENTTVFNSEDKAYILNQLTDESKKIHRLKLSQIFNSDEGWDAIANKVKVTPKKSNYWKYAIAASIAFLIAIPFLLINNDSLQVEPPAIVNRIETGTDKAILTLEDGTHVALNKGEEFKRDNLRSNGEQLIYKAQDRSPTELTYNYLTVPRGGQFSIILSDGSRVWLNSESRLRYPANFMTGQPREVELIYGEAYFEVSPGTNHHGSSFRVITQPQSVEVLGTEFNIKAYPDEDFIFTTLVEGSVEVTNGNFRNVLRPEQQSQLDLNSHRVLIKEVDIFNETSWKDGILFSFKGKSLKDVMSVLSRWYDVDVEFSTHEIQELRFTGILGKEQKISNILDLIQSLGHISSYNIIDKKVTIR